MAGESQTPTNTRDWIDPVMEYIDVLRDMSPWVQALFLVLFAIVALAFLFTIYKIKTNQSVNNNASGSGDGTVPVGALIHVVQEQARQSETLAEAIRSLSDNSDQLSMLITGLTQMVSEVKSSMNGRALCPHDEYNKRK